MTALDRLFLTLILLFVVPIAVVILNVLYFQLMMLLASRLNLNHFLETRHEDAPPTFRLQKQWVTDQPANRLDASLWCRTVEARPKS